MTLKVVSSEAFNPNDGQDAPGFPVIEHVHDIDTYANFFTNLAPNTFEQWATRQHAELEANRQARKVTLEKGMTAQKSLALPPEMLSFATYSVMPETQNGGVIQWPGLPPDALRKIVRENLAPQTIINMRVDDVLRYSNRSTHPWKPGWRIKMRKGFDVPDNKIRKDIQDACSFIENCNIEMKDARQRDAKGYQDFPTFLAELIRDTLTYDGMAVFTDCDLNGRVKAFKTLTSYNIRLCLPPGYMQKPGVFAVAVDETGAVIHEFTRYDLVFRRRNPRADSDIFGYGFPEVEQAIRLIQAFQNAMDMNADVFTRNSMPNGFVVVKGAMNQKQLDILSRIWINLKRGITKQWAFPVIPVPKDGDIEIKDLSRLKDMDAYYTDFMNMVAGLFCALYRFPVKRLGYHISGKSKDNDEQTPTTAAPTIEDYDPYIAVLLGHVESLVNSYLLWSRWEHLQFEFTGKSPKEDAREYEATVLACTEDERRALSDQPTLESLGQDEDMKRLLRIMGAAPVDPAMGGIYQSAIQAVFGKPAGEGEGGKQDTPGAAMTHKKDPARAEDHGHTSGVRRDSAAEGKKA